MFSKSTFNVMPTVKETYRGAWKAYPYAAFLTIFYLFIGLLTVQLSHVLAPVMMAYAKASVFALLLFGIITSVFVTQSSMTGYKPSINPVRLLFSTKFWRFLGAFLALCVTVVATSVILYLVINYGWKANFDNVNFDFAAETGFSFEFIAIGVAFWAACFICFRLFLVLPEIASGGRMSFKKSWATMNNNAFKLGAVLFFCMFPINVVSFSLRTLATYLDPASSVHAALALIVGLIVILQIVFLAAVGASAWNTFSSQHTSNDQDTEKAAEITAAA